MVPEEDRKFVIDPRRAVTVVLLVVFFISAIIGGFFPFAVRGFYSLAGASLVVAILLGLE